MLGRPRHQVAKPCLTVTEGWAAAGAQRPDREGVHRARGAAQVHRRRQAAPAGAAVRRRHLWLLPRPRALPQRAPDCWQTLLLSACRDRAEFRTRTHYTILHHCTVHASQMTPAPRPCARRDQLLPSDSYYMLDVPHHHAASIVTSNLCRRRKCHTTSDPASLAD